MADNGDVNFQGDWLGFTYNGVHSSTFNIVRTISSGDRFEKNLLPQQDEKTATMVGKDGQYFFKSNYQAVNINISFAYDNLSETQIRALRQWLGDKKQHGLIMDEEPYKQYFAKTTGKPKLSYIAFDSNDKAKRIYKGEGEIEFISYEPYARHVHKTIDSYTGTTTQWEEASGLLTTTELISGYDIFDGVTGIANIYNPGDVETPFIITDLTVLPAPEGETSRGYQIFTQKIDGDIVNQIVIDLDQLDLGTSYKLDSRLRLLVGYTNGFPDNSKVSNRAIVAGDFFNLQTRNSLLESGVQKAQTVTASPAPGTKITITKQNGLEITYDYLYY